MATTLSGSSFPLVSDVVISHTCDCQKDDFAVKISKEALGTRSPAELTRTYFSRYLVIGGKASLRHFNIKRLFAAKFHIIFCFFNAEGRDLFFKMLTGLDITFVYLSRRVTIRMFNAPQELDAEGFRLVEKELGVKPIKYLFSPNSVSAYSLLCSAPVETADILASSGRAIMSHWVTFSRYQESIYDFNLTICQKCSVWGHTESGCKSSPRCIFCAGSHHKRDRKAQDNPLCANCGKRHPAFARKCKSHTILHGYRE
ncbi:hypothetical protein ACOME3_007122 [Neoechinorhynchus agilis]